MTHQPEGGSGHRAVDDRRPQRTAALVKLRANAITVAPTAADAVAVSPPVPEYPPVTAATRRPTTRVANLSSQYTQVHRAHSGPAGTSQTSACSTTHLHRRRNGSRASWGPANEIAQAEPSVTMRCAPRSAAASRETTIAPSPQLTAEDGVKKPGSRPKHAVTSGNANGNKRYPHRHRGQVPRHR
jgi:hypothetical protein